MDFPNTDPSSIARQYQLELARKAVDENVIVVLETGCGKTLISILLMRHLHHLIKKPNNTCCVFLAPTVLLVNQQARVIQQYTDFKVGVFCGDNKHLKTHSAWEKELAKCEVLVMTPQVLLRSLCHCFIRMEAIALLIFDECHYAQVESNHPYAEIMKVFYDTEAGRAPRIFGMTASPICGKGASINSLQTLLNAKVYTVNDKSELEAVVVSPVVQVYQYTFKTKVSSSSLFRCFEKLGVIKRQCTSTLCRTIDDPCKVQILKKNLHKLHKNMEFSLTSLGLWGALQACQIRLNNDGYERNELVEASGNGGDDFILNEYLAQTASMLDTECRSDVADGIASADESCTKLLKEPFFSQKVLRLVGILSNFRSRPYMKCIIFVNRIIVAQSLAYILGQIKIMSAWKCDYLVGVHSGLKDMSRNAMSNILEEFRSGKLNLLVATKVGEEGLDIQTCCLVIRFDLPETLASFIQSRGRARMPQSEYAFLVDSESEREMSLMESFRKGEDRMNIDIRDRKPNGVVANIKEELYSVDSSGATISTHTSVSLLYHYCSKLPRDEFFNPKPELYYVHDTEGTICHLILPSNAAVHHVVSTPQPSAEAAKKDACLRACKDLHEIGALTKYLLPEQDDNSEEETPDIPDSDSTDGEDSSFELHEMLVPAALKGPWSSGGHIVSLHGYFIKFMPKPHDRQYREFGLFVKAPLPSGAENLNIDLHLAHGRSVLTDLVASGRIKFNDEEMLLAQSFQEMCLKVILDRSDFTCDHVSLKNCNFSEPNSSKFYLLLPVTGRDSENRLSVDWMTIKTCLSSPTFTPSHSVDTKNPLEAHLQLADGAVSMNIILNSLVYVAHKKSFYFVSGIIHDRNGYSLHNSSISHIENWSEKFGVHLAHPEQPLLQAKQLFCLRNLLHGRKKGNSDYHEIAEHFIELPPEVCKLKVAGFSKEMGSSLSLLPSIMHRLENFLVAIELKDTLSKSFAEGSLVTTEHVLEALTTEKCRERFSLERLEVLGDAFLKFVVGRYLFLKHEADDEGQLTRRRSNVVSNSNLHQLALCNNLQVYIRDQEFDPTQFYTLGRPSPAICTKQMETSIHFKVESNLVSQNYDRQVRCSKNHHWLSKKTIADVVEALVGAYIVDGGFSAAIAFLRWIGIEVEFDVSQVCQAWTSSTGFMPLANYIDIRHVEGILGHRFVHTGLCLQAFVHPSFNQHRGGCYQRLEFLGDAVLDYLMTSYLYSVFPDLKPGQLTDLRSALVSNSSFAQVAANSLYKYILCQDSNLSDAINKFVRFSRKLASERCLLQEPPCPKALGDLVESCVGAVLLDAGFDLNYVWKIVLSLLEPVMRLSDLQFSPVRELLELSQHHGWETEFLPSKKGRNYAVQARVQGEAFSEVASAINFSKRTAKKMAAQRLTAKLKAQGYKSKKKPLEELLKSARKMEAKLIGFDEIPLARCSATDLVKREDLSLDDRCATLVTTELDSGSMQMEDQGNWGKMQEEQTVSSYRQKKLPRAGLWSSKRWERNEESKDEKCRIESESNGGAAKLVSKARLNQLCVANCWGAPMYVCCEDEGPSHLRRFRVKVVVIIEEAEVVEVECYSGCQSKKKVAADEAAEGALWYLEKRGYRI